MFLIFSCLLRFRVVVVGGADLTLLPSLSASRAKTAAFARVCQPCVFDSLGSLALCTEVEFPCFLFADNENNSSGTQNQIPRWQRQLRPGADELRLRKLFNG
ncbi:hypothetical protein B0J14DRAFT_103267 [Halenospora varia]|nr:hypothetical protein B0J14DRAFT_103267 [Halenospora varia]